MPMYTGCSSDGSDMKEVEGMYINPNNPNEWSNRPYPEQQRLINMQNELYSYMDGMFCLNDVYNQIKKGECPLPKRVREYVISHYDEFGNFITTNTLTELS